jgi:putative DNA primase/helicase
MKNLIKSNTDTQEQVTPEAISDKGHGENPCSEKTSGECAARNEGAAKTSIACGYPDIGMSPPILGVLEPRHRKMLMEESAISEAAIEARGYFSISVKEIAKTLGFSEKQAQTVSVSGALCIPVFNHAGEPSGYTLRPDIPRNGANGKPGKYESLPEQPPVLDVAPLTRHLIGDVSKPLIITEGTKKADAAASQGLPAIALNGVYGFRGKNATGGAAVLPDWEYIPVNERIVYLVFDSDAATNPRVEAALFRVARFLGSRRAIVKIVHLPHGENGKKTGLDDFFARGGTVAELFALARDVDSLHEGKRKRKDEQHREKLEKLLSNGKPVIETYDRQMTDVMIEMEDAIAVINAVNPMLYHGTAGVVSLAHDNRGNPDLALARRETIQSIAAAAANWTHTTPREGPRSVAPPLERCSNYLADSRYWKNLLPLDAIAEAPFFAADGSLCATPGYHKGARTWLHLPTGFSLPDITPTRENVDRAKKLLMEQVLGEVAFADPSSRAHALALIFLAFVRAMIAGPTPLHLFDSPTQGSGKTYTVQVCTAPFARVVPSTDKKNEEEMRKFLMSQLATGQSHLFLDNIKTGLGDPNLAAAITSPLGTFSGRLIGTNSQIQVSTRCVWVATSNNAILDKDAVERCMVIKLDTGMENPGQRRFKQDPLAFIEKNRAEVVGAILTLVKHWQAQGSPVYAGPHQWRFPEWQRTMGGILECMGVKGFLDNLETYRDALDPETAGWREFVGVWFQEYGEKFVGAADLVPHALLVDELAGRLEGSRGSVSHESRSMALSMGKLLQKRCDAVFGGYKVVRGTPGNKGVRWRLQALQSPAKAASAATDVLTATGHSGDSGDSGSNSNTPRETEILVSRKKGLIYYEKCQSGDAVAITPTITTITTPAPAAPSTAYLH